MSSSIYQSELIFNLNERLFNNSLEGVTEEQAKERISGHSNPLNWIAGHTVWARYNMLMFLGKPEENPYNFAFENFKAYDAAIKYPTLSEIKKEWANVSGKLKKAVDSVSEEHLSGASPINSPIGDSTNGGTIAFFAQHESYDVGQMAYLKKYFTGEAMKY